MKLHSFIPLSIVLVMLVAACGSNSASNQKAATAAEVKNTEHTANSGDQTTPSEKKAPATENTSTQNAVAVIINGITLDASQIKAFIALYKIEPKPGNYWYDTNSGLFGVVGYPAYGFMHPGHQFGTMKENASAGNTQVFINGRNLPQSEWLVWSQLLGAAIAPGRYWLDGYGNAGNEGNPYPTVNLYVAAQQNAYRGNSQGGDNFWSSRFGAGNSNADNSQGYVSVPGYGPVGYGF